MNSNLLNQVKLDLVTASTANGTSTINGGIVDMAGWDGAIFFTTIQSAASNNGLKIQQGNDSGLSDAADLAGSLQSSGSSDEGVIVEVYRPLERYLRPVVVRGTTTVVGEIWCLRYRGRSNPTSNSTSGTQAAKTVVSPAEGTA